MSAIGTYEETAVTTQNKGRLVVMLYEGAIKFLKHAIRAIHTRDAEAKGLYLTKAQNIIAELNSALDMQAGGEITKNLRALYNFMSRQLNEANFNRDERLIAEVITILEDLNSAWRTVAC